MRMADCAADSAGRPDQAGGRSGSCRLAGHGSAGGSGGCGGDESRVRLAPAGSRRGGRPLPGRLLRRGRRRGGRGVPGGRAWRSGRRAVVQHRSRRTFSPAPRSRQPGSARGSRASKPDASMSRGCAPGRTPGFFTPTGPAGANAGRMAALIRPTRLRLPAGPRVDYTPRAASVGFRRPRRREDREDP